MSDSKDLLRAPFELAYNYKRSNGPVMSKFFDALEEQKILGTKSSTGKVFSPAAEFDPDTHESLNDMVEVVPEDQLLNLLVGLKPHKIII